MHSASSYGARLPLWIGLLFLVLNLIQGGFTPLDPDEAYYVMYARSLDWGYYDHPPAVALLIRAGMALAGGELGVRMGAALALTAALYLMWLLAGRPQGRNAVLLALLAGAMPFLQLYGFIATPDGPLLLAAAFFWWAYASFLDRPSAVPALLWGLSMALLLYSKYHGLLVIGFTVLSNFRLWRNGWFYLAGIVGVLLFLPHLYWQYANDFPSFRYHLVGRDDPYELKHTLNYVVNQLTMFNPLLLPWWAPALWAWRRQGALGRAYVYTALGFWLFFLWSTTKGHAEPQWTAVLTIPIVLGLYRALASGEINSRWPQRLAIVSVGLFLAFRLAMAWPGLTPLRQFRNADWIADLSAYAGSRPVIFENSYRDASLYRFYSGKPAWNITNVQYRRSQYDLWNDEQSWQNKPVVLVGQRGWPCPSPCDTLNTGRLFKHLLAVDSFQALQKLELLLLAQPPFPWKAGDTVALQVALYNPYPFAVAPGSGKLPAQLSLLASTGLEQWHYWPATQGAPAQIAANARLNFTVQWPVPADFPAGVQHIGLGWQYAGMPPALQSPLTATGR